MSLRTCVVTLTLASACADEYEPPPIVWEGEHLRFGTDRDLSEVCAGTLPYADRLVGYLGDKLGREGAKVDYYWVDDLAGTGCPDHTDACAPGSRVFALQPFYQHELVHAVGGVAKQGYHTGIEEGVAMAFGDDGVWPPFRTEDILPMLEQHDASRRLEDAYYPLAGHFASFLRAYGSDEQLAELWFSSRRHPAQWPALRTRIAEIFAADFDDILAEYLETYPGCDPSRYRDSGLECSVVDFAVPSDGSIARQTIDLACDLEHARGPVHGVRWTTLAFDVATQGGYMLGVRKVGGSRGGGVSVRRCGQNCIDEPADVFDVDVAVETETKTFVGSCAEAGRYRIILAIAAEDEGVFELEIWRIDQDVPTSCG